MARGAGTLGPRTRVPGTGPGFGFGSVPGTGPGSGSGSGAGSGPGPDSRVPRPSAVSVLPRDRRATLRGRSVML
ncbi:hypothetical protein GCM10018784_29130 [Streptomyces hydrogenans]|nr:hypothetical protein GCM10018784_29130 [Streptomyces hydrogenans]